MSSLDNVYTFGKKEEYKPINWEIYLLGNSSKYKIDIYSCFKSTSAFGDGYESYVFKRRKDDKFICELSTKLEFIVPVQIPVSSKDFEIAMDRLREYIERHAWIDEYFSIE